MKLELTESQVLLLIELLEAEHREKLHELHHTFTSDYKKLLRERIQQIEELTEVVRPAVHAARP